MIPFIDLKAQQDLIRPQIDAAIKKVLDHGKYIMGPEVSELEEQLASFCGAKHAISCSSGTDALLMILMAKGIKAGDAIFLPSFTFTATAEVVSLLGANPVFIDIDEKTFNLDATSLKQGVQMALDKGLKPKAVIAVDLFGQPANYPAIEKVAEEHDLWVLADAAQSFGATLNGKKVGQFGLATATSFFPAKPLGCYGDGGCIFTDDDELAEILKSIRVHGQGKHKYDNIRVGLNARFDTIQAAILIEKLKIFPDELLARQKTAVMYDELLEGVVRTPYLIEGATSSWAQYTITLFKKHNREVLQAQLKEAGIPSVVYYEKCIHEQEAYKGYSTATGKGLLVCESLGPRVLSLPMSGYVDSSLIQKISKILRDN